jgi:hypothetical protein
MKDTNFQWFSKAMGESISVSNTVQLAVFIHKTDILLQQESNSHFKNTSIHKYEATNNLSSMPGDVEVETV